MTKDCQTNTPAAGAEGRRTMPAAASVATGEAGTAPSNESPPRGPSGRSRRGGRRTFADGGRAGSAATGSAPPRRRVRAGALAVPVLMSAALLAGCHGGSGKADDSSPAGTPSSGAGASQRPSPLAYAACMRKHGVPNFPDPNGLKDNGFVLPKDVKDNPHFQSARTACRSLGSRGRTGTSPGGAGSNTQRVLALARCMRANGVPNFPDPNAQGGLKLGPGLDPQSPTFQKALTLCVAKTRDGSGQRSGTGRQP